MSQFKIYRADPKSHQLISDIAMRSKAYWGYSPEFMEACRVELTYSPSFLSENDFFVVKDQQTIVGFYGLVKLSEMQIELEALFIEPDLIGRGLGRLLIEHAFVTAKASGAQEMIIQGDPNAAHFYTKIGGKLISEKESVSIPGRFLPLFSVDLMATAQHQ